jgi:hypothetical protein
MADVAVTPSYLALQLYIVPLAAFLAYVVYIRFFSPLAGIPGPWSASLSRLWLIQHSLRGDMHRATIELHNRHGKLVRTGPKEVSVSDLSAIKKIYGSWLAVLGRQ